MKLPQGRDMSGDDDCFFNDFGLSFNAVSNRQSSIVFDQRSLVIVQGFTALGIIRG